MGLSATRTAFWLALGGCAWLSLRPDPRFERWIDVLLSPTRVLSELCAPLAWLRARSIRAAETQLAEREDAEYAEREALHEAERRAALPSREELRVGRRFVHAEVIARRKDNFDQIVIRLDGASCEGLARDMPVTAGDVFVGRLVELDLPAPGQAVVELVTSRRFAIGGCVDGGSVDGETQGEPVRGVVGGLASISRAKEGRIYLALSNPTRRDPRPGPVRVDESLSVLARYAAQADGFELGHMQAVGASEWALEPLVDYRAGLFEVVVAAPAGIARAPESERHDELLDGSWQPVRATSVGEPSLAREGLEIGAGAWNGAREGAALVIGARLVGRVEHAGALASDARTLGDPGFSVHALARLDGRDAPLALGRLVSLGRPRDAQTRDEVEFLWEAVVEIAAPGARSVHARLFTGSGDALVPRGLVLGETELPVGPGPHRIRVVQGVDTRDVRHLWLRVANDGAAP